MRARGLRPIQIWVPDTRTTRFAEEAHRQSLVVAKSASEREDQAFIDAVTDHDRA
ncbi:MAG: antitoxin MazE family protein [Magnetospirillum sp. WYHS-4]